MVSSSPSLTVQWESKTDTDEHYAPSNAEFLLLSAHVSLVPGRARCVLSGLHSRGEEAALDRQGGRQGE